MIWIKGVISRIKMAEDSDGKSYKVKIKYEVKGQTYDKYIPHYSFTAPQVGTEVEVGYLPGSPQKIESFSWLFIVITALVGIIGLVILCFVLAKKLLW